MSNYFEFEKRNLEMFTNLYRKNGSQEHFTSAKRVLNRMLRKELISSYEWEKRMRKLEEM